MIIQDSTIITLAITSCLIIYLLSVIILRNRKTKILRDSIRINKLKRLNENYKSSISFIQNEEYYFDLNSKSQFDRISLKQLLNQIILENKDKYERVIEELNNNIEHFEKYQNEIERINQENNPILKHEDLELKLFNNMIAKNEGTFEILIGVSYISPKGRNRYYYEEIFNSDLIKIAYIESISDLKNKQTRQYQIQKERSFLTESLRFDILSRDNYSCQICGSTAQDGVKLHVDHIHPVSKGGKTIPSNLQTLCDRCNMGKSDKTF